MVKCFSVFWIFFAVLRRFGFPKLYTILADCSHVREERDGEGNDDEVFLVFLYIISECGEVSEVFSDARHGVIGW